MICPPHSYRKDYASRSGYEMCKFCGDMRKIRRPRRHHTTRKRTGHANTRVNKPRHERRQSGSSKKVVSVSVAAVIAGMLILVLFMSGSVDTSHLTGIAADGLGNATDNVIALNPEMAAEAERIAQEQEAEAERIAQEYEARVEKILQEREAENAVRHMETAKEQMVLINDIRTSHGVPPIQFDERAYRLALARVHDIIEYDYPIAHTNPFTGTCPDNMKHRYGFARHEYVAENVGSGYSGYEENINGWMGSPGHKTNLLWPTHYGGAVACDKGICVFLGTNQDRYGAGCY